ncbi:potassium channel family protein [Metabacillus sp. GX 13764]|uniref:ion channel n=1 Tax=Metabacillus kandeliae TaxID=2900151 RepID=UPI001E457629|nr:ion channel [Metabacillus kandeliae]MCD7036406.1 potassium channel family protein [Metabacillus kandeliae]
MEWIIGAATVFCLYMSAKITVKAFQEQEFMSLEVILTVFLFYLSILIGFGMIYLLFLHGGLDILELNGVPAEGNYVELLYHSLYFSAITLFSVGYGEMVPVGIGRLVAVLEAMTGYILPVVIVARTVYGLERR